MIPPKVYPTSTQETSTVLITMCNWTYAASKTNLIFISLLFTDCVFT